MYAGRQKNVQEVLLMVKITEGDRFPDFQFSTPYRKDVKLSDEMVPGGKTILVFLRYYGCPVCQYDMVQYARQYDQIRAAGGKMLVVLQSDPDRLRQELGDETIFPFEIICDPEESLYHEFGILPAPGKLKMIGPKTMIKIAKVQAEGFKHGISEGEELQLPAAFILNPDMTVSYAHYAKWLDDMPGAAELTELLK
jgi:peroxiredoxin